MSAWLNRWSCGTFRSPLKSDVTISEVISYKTFVHADIQQMKLHIMVIFLDALSNWQLKFMSLCFLTVTTSSSKLPAIEPLRFFWFEDGKIFCIQPSAPNTASA